MVDVRGNDTELTSRPEYPVALLKDTTKLVEEIDIATRSTDVSVSAPIVRLVPIRRTGDDKVDAAVLDPGQIARVALTRVKRVQIELLFLDSCAHLFDEVRVLIDADRLTAFADRGDRR